MSIATITVFDEYDRISFVYTPDTKPEVYKNLGGGFDICYLSGFEEEFGTKYTECHYNRDYYYVAS